MREAVLVAIAVVLTSPLMGRATEAGPAAILAAPAVQTASQETALALLLRKADGWLLAGEGVPPELGRLLQPLSPADRLTAVAYLRRTGLLEGPALDLDGLLSPVSGAQ